LHSNTSTLLYDMKILSNVLNNIIKNN